MSRTFAAGVTVLILLLVPLSAAEVATPPAPATGSAENALGPRLASAARSVGDAASAGAQTAGDALASLGRGIASAAAGALHLLSSLVVGIADAARAAGAAIASATVAVASALGLVARSSYEFVRAHPKESAIAAGSAGGLAVLYALAKKLAPFAFALYTRLRPSEMLDNEQRNRVYEHVRANPGAHPSGIADALDLGWGTVVYHLSRLEQSKLVAAKSAHQRKCFFVVGTELGADARTAVAAMSHDKAKLIVRIVRGNPGISQKAVAEQVGMSQALASWHVKRLIESGVLLATREGRSNALSVAAHVPDLGSGVAAPAAAAVA